MLALNVFCYKDIPLICYACRRCVCHLLLWKGLCNGQSELYLWRLYTWDLLLCWWQFRWHLILFHHCSLGWKCHFECLDMSILQWCLKFFWYCAKYWLIQNGERSKFPYGQSVLLKSFVGFLRGNGKCYLFWSLCRQFCEWGRMLSDPLKYIGQIFWEEITN